MPFEDIPLSDGRKIPAIAFGTGSIYKWTDVTHYVQQALEAGFSHIDTAQAYETEGKPSCSRGVSSLTGPLDSLRRERHSAECLGPVGLLHYHQVLAPEPIRGRVHSEQSVPGVFAVLGLKFVDLYLIHQPSLSKDIVGTWVELEGVKKAGLAKSIGVSNFPVSVLAQIEADPRVHSLPTVNQIQLHPYNYAQQKATVDWCQARGIVVEAYGGLSSLTKYPGGPVDLPVAAAARKLGISPTQVLMGWLRAKGVVIVTTTSNKGRLEEYLASGDLSPLPPSYVAAIDEAGAKGPPGAVSVAFERLSTLTGTSCDEIFYASTYSGGLGCYAANYIANGGVLGNLPPLGTHRCVAAADNSAHGGAVNRWYVNNRIPDGGVFYFSFLIPANGCMNAASSYCRRMFNVANGYVGDSYGQICSDGLADGRQFAGITTSQRTQHPRCPSRGYGPANITGSDDDADSQSDDSEDDEDLVGDMSLVPGPAPSLTDHVYKLSSQRFIWSPFRSNVTLAVGDTIMVPVNDTSTDSDVEEEETVVAAGRFQDVVGTDSLPDCPT
ncbi:Aldo-ket-red domain-containing protein [Mycena chlorophos]|uniref:Aldo-ket-red domain-containing protein n=1 Tax=Mycena chlorophos TaxID=658473 RepID=A0A8H6ST79_MYCCL|nr:Aldo-ket-red domain-containing protein [Mycena chlorophos]